MLLEVRRTPSSSSNPQKAARWGLPATSMLKGRRAGRPRRCRRLSCRSACTAKPARRARARAPRSGVVFKDHFDGQLLQAARTQKLAEIVHDLREAAMVDVGDDFNWGWTQVQLKRTLVSKRFFILSHTKIMRAVFFGRGEGKLPAPAYFTFGKCWNLTF